MASRMSGNDIIASTTRMIGPSRLRKNPATSPSSTPAVTEIATGEILGVETDDLVSGRVKRGNEDGPDIPGVARDQNLHRISNPSTALRT